MRYSELVGKEIVDLAEGVRIGGIIGSDLVIDCERGTVEALLIYQRRGFCGAREIQLAWSSIRSLGRDLIVVDMLAEDISGRGMLQLPGRYLPVDTETNVSVSRPAKHRVVGIDKPEQETEAESTESPQELLARLARGEKSTPLSIWRLRKRA